MVDLPPDRKIVAAAAYVSGANAPAGTSKTLMAFKLYLNGRLIGVGPGRGEAPVFGGDGRFRSLPYRTFDVTEAVLANASSNKALLALSGIQCGCGGHPPTPGTSRSGAAQGASVLFELVLQFSDGGRLSVGSDASWSAKEADSFYNPGGWPGSGGSAGLGESGNENLDGRNEVLGWNSALTLPPAPPGSTARWPWSPAVVVPPPVANQSFELHSKMAHDEEIIDMPEARAVPMKAAGSFFVDFLTEFQGGLRLRVKDGKLNATVKWAAGEQATADANGWTLGNTWRAGGTMTLRDGPQLLEMHKYIEFRYVTLQFSGSVPSDWGLGAWKVRQPYIAAESHFESDNATLNRVWELCRNTLDGGVIGTFTDSNTRERQPYEADGLVAVAARSLIQRNTILWARHSSSYVFSVPSGGAQPAGALTGAPVQVSGAPEWLQQNANLAWWDYMNSGTTELFQAHEEALFRDTMIGRVVTKDGLPPCDVSVGHAACGCHMDGGTIELKCPAGGKFTAVRFASIGTPQGGCTNMSAGDCHADITLFVTKLCVGKASCSIVADINVVNAGKDPCPGVAKSVYVELACSGSGTFANVSSKGLVGYAPGQVHIVGWDPEYSQEPQRLMFKPSTYQFSSNAFAYRGLRILSALANATTMSTGGSSYLTKGIQYEQQAQALRGTMMQTMWNETAQSFCDGICTDPLIQTNTSGGFGGIYTHMYSLYLGLTPARAAPATWSYVADWGLEMLGDWGAYALQSALADFNEGWGQGESGNVEAGGGGDDGTALLTMLTKCDDDSWCAMWEKFNATMTRETFFGWFEGSQGETLSHPWGTAAIPAIVQGVVGVTPTSPEYATFKIKPRLGGGLSEGGLRRVSLVMPTLRGPIAVNIRSAHVCTMIFVFSSASVYV